VDFTLMQQDAFDPVDCYCPLERQRFMASLVQAISRSDFQFKGFEEIAPWYKRVINCIRQMNYCVFDSAPFRKHREELEQILAERRKA
jgi:V/A-type H+/Na+-transporting ATPase subunit A